MTNKIKVKSLSKIKKSQALNVIKGNDGLYVIKSGKLIKIIQTLFPYGQSNLYSIGTACRVDYVLEDGEIINAYA